MKIAHFIITRFCYRAWDTFSHINSPTFNDRSDPLRPENLEFRLKLLEMIAAPAIIDQTNNNFSWIIIVDRELPTRYKDQLQRVIQAKNNAFLYTYTLEDQLERLDWLVPYIEDNADAVVTTLHDDDDAIPLDFVEKLQGYLLGEAAQRQFTDYKILGCKEIVQWDLMTSSDYPLGWKSDWHRGSSVASCGFTLYCKYPEYNFSIMGMRHPYAEHYFNAASDQCNEHIEQYRKKFSNTEKPLSGNIEGNRFYNLSREVGPVLMSNHYGNDQIWRLIENKSGREPVNDTNTFSGFSINWEMARKHSRLFSIRNTKRQLFGRIFSGFGMRIFNPSHSIFQQLKDIYAKVRWLVFS